MSGRRTWDRRSVTLWIASSLFRIDHGPAASRRTAHTFTGGAATGSPARAPVSPAAACARPQDVVTPDQSLGRTGGAWGGQVTLGQPVGSRGAQRHGSSGYSSIRQDARSFHDLSSRHAGPLSFLMAVPSGRISAW